MTPDLNPYTPGAGITPHELAGRQDDINSFDSLIARTKLHRTTRSPMLSGLRGVGKTVLLNKLREMAERHEWAVAQFEARPDDAGRQSSRRIIAQALVRASLPYRGRKAAKDIARMLGSVTSFSVGMGFDGVNLGFERDAVRASSGILELDLQDVVSDVCSVLAKHQRALGIFIDELQDLDDELLAALLSVQHYANQRGLPFYLVGAGLPNLPGRLTEARSYAERLFDYREIGRLPEPAARAALRAPAESVAGPGCFPDAALDLLTEESGRYPYFIQEYGSAIWAAATSTPFTLDDARTAVELGRAQLDSGFFPARWDKATALERDYLSAMALDGDEISRSGEIARRLKVEPKALSTPRKRLIDKGLIYAPATGDIAFTVPGMAAFISRQEHHI